MASETKSTEKARKLTPTQARAARRMRHQRRKRLVRYAIAGGIGLLAFVFIIALFVPDVIGLFGRGGGLGFGGAPTGPGTRLLEVSREHVVPGQEHQGYNSTPATSGPHYGVPLAPARWGIHDQPLPDEVLVHNLEHGGIGVHYNCPEGCPELVSQLSGIVTRAVEGGLKVIMSPYPGMDSRIALTAWTFIDKFEEYDEDRIKDFINAHESSPNSPEPFAR